MGKILIKKRRQLTADEKGVYWALAKCKKGYSTINKELRLLLVTAFNDHPHVIVLPNPKDKLQVKDADCKKVSVHKVLTQVGLGIIFSDIVRDNPTIKGKVGERAFRYIVTSLGCVRQFTESYKQRCGCTKCVGLHTFHCPSFAAGKTWCHAPTVCNQRTVLHTEGAGRGEGKGMGQC